MKDNTNIVIIRQYGSGGREVSSILAKKLGFHRYDRTIVQMAAEKLSQQEGYDIDVDELLKDSYDLPQNQLGNLGDFAFERIPYFNKMYRQQAVAMLKLAQKGKAVFLGRCADFILKDVPNTFFFFIYADDEFRATRAKDHYGSHSLADLDKEAKNREKYYAYYTGEKWGDPKHFHMMINTSQISLEKAADLIIDYIETHQKTEA
ncbi:MAG TPA: cytidylate kinase-like family protein [Megamonas hypermegale]|uniref:Cytidylate kinase-like family protein n=1 Tax=Megamonas hypermegale TaxID=158847 RepID=A0A921L7R8_9FIRM|nr:cytidylate kinase-like family protein [Megamonas hypermegale]